MAVGLCDSFEKMMIEKRITGEVPGKDYMFDSVINS